MIKVIESNWVQSVKTVSTFPPKGLFTKDAETIAKVMATKRVSPKGLGSAILMVQYYINRAGKNLSPERRSELEKAKSILQKKHDEEKEK
jgi:tRNA(adenine34) deaminase